MTNTTPNPTDGKEYDLDVSNIVAVAEILQQAIDGQPVCKSTLKRWIHFMQTETDVQNLSILAIEQHGGGALRNNSGCLPREDGTPVRFGLGNISEKFNREFKTGDLIGLYHGRFCMWECKKPGWKWSNTSHERAQFNAIRWTRQHGGHAGFVTHPDEAVAIMLGASFGAYHGR